MCGGASLHRNFLSRLENPIDPRAGMGRIIEAERFFSGRATSSQKAPLIKPGGVFCFKGCMTKQAHYRCMKCSNLWSFPITIMKGGQVVNPMNGCPSCGHLYANWINYQSDFTLTTLQTGGIILPAVRLGAARKDVQGF